jgi:hypothetical protein
MATQKCNEKIDSACEIAELLKKELELVFNSIKQQGDMNGTTEQREIGRIRSQDGNTPRLAKRNKKRS